MIAYDMPWASKFNVRAACPNDELEFKIFSRNMRDAKVRVPAQKKRD